MSREAISNNSSAARKKAMEALAKAKELESKKETVKVPIKKGFKYKRIK